MTIMRLVLVFVFGTVIGSFLNVCICRIPKKESIVSPGSHCPHCKHPLGVRDLIPLLSQIVLGGKCRYCGGKISFRYFVVELLTALLFAVLYYRFIIYEWYAFRFGLGLILSGMLVAITFIDLEHKIIPDKITYPGIVIGLLLNLFSGGFRFPFGSIGSPSLFLSSLLGLIVGGGIIFLIGIIAELILKQEAMGFGDVKLAAMLGAFLGSWKLVVVNLFLAFLLGGIIAIILLLFKIKGRKDYIPFGPYLALGGIVTFLWGEYLLTAYFQITMF